MRETRNIRLDSPEYGRLNDLGWKFTNRKSWYLDDQCFAEMIAPVEFYGSGLNWYLNNEDKFQGGNWTYRTPSVLDTFEIPTIEEDIEALVAVCESKTTHPDTLILADILHRILLREKHPLNKVETQQMKNPPLTYLEYGKDFTFED